MRSRAGISGVPRCAAVLVVVVLAASIAVRRIMPNWWVLRRDLMRRFFVRRLVVWRIFVPRVAVVIAVVYVTRFVPGVSWQAAYAAQRSVAALHLVLPLIPQFLKI